MVRLLIVDDEPRTRKGLSSFIEKSALPIEIAGTAPNGTEGLALAKTLLPDIILTDVRMPKLERVLAKHCGAFLFAQKKSDIFIIHLCGLKSLPDSYNALIRRIYEEMQDALSASADLFLAVGSPVPDPEKLYDSYINAIVCMKMLFFTGYNHLCFFKNTDKAVSVPFCPEENLYPDFTRALKDGDRQEAAHITARLFQQIRRTDYKFGSKLPTTYWCNIEGNACDMQGYKYEANSIKDVYCQLLMKLDSVCQERGLSDVLPHDGDFIWESVSQSNTIFSLHDYLTDRLALYFDALTSRDGTSLLAYRIRQYVETHFQEPALSINQMAQDLHFTPAYLCQIFKNETGITINTYINTFRIEKAKDLLLTEDTRLYEISYDVGYNDPNYFSRQFKKQVGMTPSEYRERHAL